MKHLAHLTLALGIAFATESPTHAATSAAVQIQVRERVAAELPALLNLYRELHAKPELSYLEKETSRRVAEEFAKAGFEVTRNVGGHGVVGVLRNGKGPIILVRCDTDGLPVEEATGLPFASRHRMKDETGAEVATMHACGHDIHMTSVVGAARVLAAMKDRWQGTLMVIAQPAEERGGGAKAMLEDGLYARYPVPDQALALHVHAAMPAGTIGYTPGYALANVDSVDLKIFGVGGHGAYPHATKDPIVLAAQIILALQTIVSREIEPIEPAVITVGSIHGGTKHNVIPNEVNLQLTVRSYTDQVREKLLEGIRRVAKGQAVAAGFPENRMPVVQLQNEHTPSTYNDPALTLRLRDVFDHWLGKGTAMERKPQMGGEDFGRYGRTEHKVPICIFWLGAVSPESVRRSIQTGGTLPSLHSSLFAPDAEPTVRTGVTAMTAAVLELMGK